MIYHWKRIKIIKKWIINNITDFSSRIWQAHPFREGNTRTIVFSEAQQEIWDIVREAHDKAIKAIKPGLKCCEIDKVARDIISDYGYGDNFIHSTGHSLGLDIHETPGFSTRDETVIEKGMVITVEPGIYLEGEFGVRLEDTVLISKKASIIGDLPLNL